MRHKTIILLFAIPALVLAAVVTWPRIRYYMLTGCFFPVENIETLQNPVAVSKWSPDGLNLADGRTVRLPGLRSLPSNSAALTEATKRGVEVGADGRVWGLVRVHHWCGNDPVREHIVRVDLSDMMTFLRVGEPVGPVPAAELLNTEPGGTFTEWGWRIEEFLQFQSWQSISRASRAQHDETST
jgi:hypothetical protein